MGRKLIYLLIVVSFLLTGVIVFAQPKEMGKIDQVSPAFKGRLDRAEQILRPMVQLFDKIDRQKLVTQRDSDDLEKAVRLMYEYAEAMKAAYDEALRDAEKAGKTHGKEGNVANLRAFEEISKAHEKRVKEIEMETKGIEAKIKDGIIVIDKPLLQKMKPAEREEFRKFLSPEGLKKMEMQHPDIFRPGTNPGASLAPLDGGQLAKAIKGFCNSFPAQIGNFFVSTAEAEIAARCIPPCSAQNWPACVACIVATGPPAIDAWNRFKSCWDGCCDCKWFRPWCCACKAKCLADFIKRLA